MRIALLDHLQPTIVALALAANADPSDASGGDGGEVDVDYHPVDGSGQDQAFLHVARQVSSSMNRTGILIDCRQGRSDPGFRNFKYVQSELTTDHGAIKNRELKNHLTASRTPLRGAKP